MQIDLLAAMAAILFILKGEGWVEALPETYIPRFW
jgi:hypothetical protein